MVQECDMPGVSNSDNNFSLGTANEKDILEEILTQNPKVEIVEFSDGEYVQFNRTVRYDNTSYCNFYFVKLNGS